MKSKKSKTIQSNETKEYIYKMIEIIRMFQYSKKVKKNHLSSNQRNYLFYNN